MLFFALSEYDTHIAYNTTTIAVCIFRKNENRRYITVSTQVDGINNVTTIAIKSIFANDGKRYLAIRQKMEVIMCVIKTIQTRYVCLKGNNTMRIYIP